MSGITVVIGSFLQADLVGKIRQARPGASVVYEPGLLPVPRYPCDHTGRRRDLGEPGLRRWRALAAEADVFFDFDWRDPDAMPDSSPGLRWVQATSAGIGGFMRRAGSWPASGHW